MIDLSKTYDDIPDKAGQIDKFIDLVALDLVKLADLKCYVNETDYVIECYVDKCTVIIFTLAHFEHTCQHSHIVVEVARFIIHAPEQSARIRMIGGPTLMDETGEVAHQFYADIARCYRQFR